MNLMFWDSPCPDDCISGFGVDSDVIWILELYNWMIGCDVSGYGSSRVTDWRYREVNQDESAESERSCTSTLLSMALFGTQWYARRGYSM